MIAGRVWGSVRGWSSRSPALRAAGWLWPYVGLWVAVSIYLHDSLAIGCQGVCAMVHGFLFYLVVGASLFLSALLAAAQSLALASRRAGST